MTDKKRLGVTENNPLGVEPVNKLIFKFAIPSIIAMIVGSVYNIVDQIFIGNYVGKLGNAATNVAFPVTTVCIALGLLFGIGGAANFNLSMGRGQTEKAGHYIGNALMSLFYGGIIVAAITEVFLPQLLVFFGAPADVLPYGIEYVRITAIGMPFLIVTTGGGHLMRADGSPRMTMFMSLIGAVINIVLDALFVIGFGWGMTGAALATIIGQIISAAIVFIYISRFKTLHITREHLKISIPIVKEVASLGTSNCFNQLAMLVVQIVLNNSLTYYGAKSIYGESTPLACAGIVIKISQMFFSVIIGISQGTQPILSFNYGAKKYDRVKEAFLSAAKAGALVSLFAFLMFQIFPRQIISIFGSGDELYFEFGIKFMRVFLFGFIVNFLQPLSSNLFASIGKPKKGVFLSLTRQIIFLLPLLVILPLILGMDGIMISQCIADMAAAITAVLMVRVEFKNLTKLEKELRA